MASPQPKFKKKSRNPSAKWSLSAIFIAANSVCAQTAPVPAATLAPVTVSLPRPAPAADVTGFGNWPLRELPVSADVITREQMDLLGAQRLADLTRLDASMTDAYNAPGYWDFLTLRGFVLDNRSNYRREGLPISAETSIPLDNKERVEILKGTSGLQAGVSAPGGLVNYVVKRPTDAPLREVTLQFTERRSLLAAVDLGGRFGEGAAFGYRLNLATESLRPLIRNLDGNRNLGALALDWRLNADTVLEAEVEASRKQQPSQQAFSLLGDRLPAPPDPRLNLNNQAWSQPSDFQALTGTVRLRQQIDANWRWSAQLGSQRLKSNDRLAYAYGCSAEDRYDRFCSDGTFDLYDFRSEDEYRTQQAARAELRGTVQAGGLTHELGFSVLASQLRNHFQPQAYNWVGIGSVDGTSRVDPDPTPADPNTNRDERSLELAVTDTVRLGERTTLWLGLRQTQLARESIRTDGKRATDTRQTIATPWLALSYRLAEGLRAYASYGEGAESQVVPNKPSQYLNAGQALPVLKSRQWEAGLKSDGEALGWQLTAFRIVRPVSNLDACSRLGLSPCLGGYDGEAVHRGLEASAHWKTGAWRLSGSATLLDARRQGSVLEPETNGQRPTNVPRTVLRAQATWRAPTLPGLSLNGLLSYEGARKVLPDGSITLPGWATVDASLRYQTRSGATRWTWTLGIDNLFDRRYWKESPYQYGHVYLYAGAPRTARASLSASF